MGKTILEYDKQCLQNIIFIYMDETLNTSLLS